MRALRRASRRLLGLFAGRRQEAELAAEIEAHLDLQTEDNLRSGMSPDEARRAALLKFGGIEAAKELYRDQRSLPVFDALWQDLRFALRTFAKSPGFVAVAVVTLALGIGSVTTIFSVIYNVLLNPFPYVPDSRRFVDVLIQDLEHGRWRGPLAVPEFLDYAEQNGVFDRVIGAWGQDRLVRTGEGAVPASVVSVTPNTFEFLGVPALLGRGIVPGDGEPGAPPVAVLSYQFWVHVFSRDPAVLGRPIVLGGESCAVVGVMPPRFTWHVADVWVPGPLDRAGREARKQFRWLQARLKPGVTLKEAETDLNVIASRLARTYPELYPKKFHVQVLTVTEYVVGRFRRTLYTLLAAVGLLLLIACCNAANMLLARATVREREMTIRAALGAGRWRIARLLLLESALFSLAGAAAGCLLAYGGLKAVAAVIPAGTNNIPYETVYALNGPVLLLTLATAAATAVLFGLAPALAVARRDVAEGLRGAGRGAAAGFRRCRLRNALVIAEVALSLVLLAGAGLLMRTFIALMQIDPGVRTEGLLLARLVMPPDQYRTAQQKRSLLQRLLGRLEGTPGIIAASQTSAPPPFGAPPSEIEIPGKTHSERWDCVLRLADDSYARAAGLRFLAGRPFSEADVEGARRVAVVNHAFVRRYFGAEDPLGRHVTLKALAAPPDPVPNPDFEIVGVFADVLNSGLRNPASPEVVVPSTLRARDLFLMIRAAVDPTALIPAVQREVWAVDRNVALQARAVEDMLSAYQYAQPRFSLFVVGIFAGVGLALVGIGVYSVVSYTVSAHTHEIGIRMALGANRRSVLAVVVGVGARLIAAGAVLGMLASFAVTRLISGQLWNVSPRDPVTLAAAVAVVAMTGLAACYFPARRATRVDPIVALRHE